MPRVPSAASPAGTMLPTAGQGGSSHLLVLCARSWDQRWEHDQDQASGAKQKHGYDVTSPAVPLSQGVSAAIYRRAWGHPPPCPSSSTHGHLLL